VSKAVIKRLGFKADSGVLQAKALKALAGEENVKVTLRGRWRGAQAHSNIETPCFAFVWDDGDITVGSEYQRTRVVPDIGGTMDIIARIEREIDERT
jgi:hypothetical protein